MDIALTRVQGLELDSIAVTWIVPTAHNSYNTE